MIRLIKDGALPRPAKCCSCGYSGNERFYFFFKYKEKWGQVLICTTCMTEAALLDEVGFTARKTTDEILESNYRLSAENARLEMASDRFRLGFDSLVSEFVAELQTEPDELPVEVSDTSESDISVPAGASNTVSLDGI